MHESIKDAPVESYELSQIKRSSPPIFKYPDYLTEARHSREVHNPETESKDMAELKKIILKKDEDDSTRLMKAKLLAQRMDEKRDINSKFLIDSIAAKLSII